MMTANYYWVKLAHIVGNWMEVIKGAPQGSFMGPFTYNIHSSDLLYAIMNVRSIIMLMTMQLGVLDKSSRGSNEIGECIKCHAKVV